MWQVLVEDGVLRPVGSEADLAFADKYLFYRFWFDDEGKECFPATQVCFAARCSLFTLISIARLRR